ncbi:neprilysin-4-like [Armigeres subalbatus]|uniref:neprilysin-4-like n=1 Tax=Armigeres subalbatus TaxID=124917 RepID=UPI002ED20A22
MIFRGIMNKQTDDKFVADNIEATSNGKISVPRFTDSTTQSSCQVFCSRFFICILTIAVIILSSIIYAIYHYASQLPDVCNSEQCLRSAAAFKQNMDISVDPCDDFYAYACGRWADDHPRPSRHGTYSWFHERQTKIYRIIRNHLETNVTESDPRPVAQAKSMYKACLIKTKGKRRDYTAIKLLLKEFDLPLTPTLISNTSLDRNHTFDWITSVAKIQRTLGLNVIIGLSIEPDHRDKSRNRITLEYDYSPDEFTFAAYQWAKTKNPVYSRKILLSDKVNGNTDNNDTRKLAKHFSKLLALFNPNMENAEMNDKTLKLVEHYENIKQSLPEFSESEDDDFVYYTVQELQNFTDNYIKPRKPCPIWQHYMDVLFANLPDVKPSLSEQLQQTPENVEFLGKLIGVVSSQPPLLVELYIWTVVVSFLIDHEFNNVDTEEDCAKICHKLMGLAVSYTIADRSFLEQTKPRIEQMVTNIRLEFDQMVLETDWMDAYTKYASLEKSKAIKSLIGFPEWILNVQKLEEHYKGLQISRTDHLQNWINGLQFLTEATLRSWQLNSSIMWDTDPSDVNAFNFMERNVIVIPVAIIQYPFYHLGLEALNYGALGETVGHEITHGFDNSGRFYDKYGDEKHWWSNDTILEYDKRAQCLVDLYSSYYVPEAKAFINGTLTLGENIADHGGLREALRAYRMHVARNGPEAVLPGFEDFTHKQLLFISYGNQYCESIRPSVAKSLLADEHCPSKFRVLGVLSNLVEFSEAFHCPAGSKMNPVQKCRVW